MKKTKRYEDGGFTFADISDEERKAGIDAAMADIERRSADRAAEVASERAGMEIGSTEEKPAKRAAPKVKAEPARKTEKAEEKAPRSERAPSSVKVEPITGPAPAKSREAAMPDVAARKAATAARQRRSAFGGENKGVYGMKSGGMASKRADGCAIRGKTRGKMV